MRFPSRVTLREFLLDITVEQGSKGRRLHFRTWRFFVESKKKGLRGFPCLGRRAYRGNLIANGGFTPESAAALISEGRADAISFGKLFISNPDLPQRIRDGVPLSPFDRTTFYTFDESGYTDYSPATASAFL